MISWMRYSLQVYANPLCKSCHLNTCATYSAWARARDNIRTSMCIHICAYSTRIYTCKDSLFDIFSSFVMHVPCVWLFSNIIISWQRERERESERVIKKRNQNSHCELESTKCWSFASSQHVIVSYITASNSHNMIANATCTYMNLHIIVCVYQVYTYDMCMSMYVYIYIWLYMHR